MNSDFYLKQVISNHMPHDLVSYLYAIAFLKNDLKNWSENRCIEIVDSGSLAKGTAISPGSDIDLLISLPNDFKKGLLGLDDIYESLYAYLSTRYENVRKQNVSIRLRLKNPLSLFGFGFGIEVDVTPARKFQGNTNFHSLCVSKEKTWKQTNVQRHISYVSQSGRLDEIKLLKIWREQHKLDFPSVYLEFLLIDRILLNKPFQNLAYNFWHILNALAAPRNNPLFDNLYDISNSSNNLSNLITNQDKNRIIERAREAISNNDWEYIIQ